MRSHQVREAVVGGGARMEAGEGPPRPRRVRKSSGKEQGAAPISCELLALLSRCSHYSKGLIHGSICELELTWSDDYYFFADDDYFFDDDLLCSPTSICCLQPNLNMLASSRSGDLFAAAAHSHLIPTFVVPRCVRFEPRTQRRGCPSRSWVGCVA